MRISFLARPALLVTPTSTAPAASIRGYAALERQRLAALALAAVLTSFALVPLVLLIHFGALVVLAAVIGLIVMLWRPWVGLLFLYALILIFEAGAADPLMKPGEYLHAGLAGAPTSPIELLLIFTFLIWLAQGIASRRLNLRGGQLVWPVFLFTVALVFGLARGLLGGGNFNIALWESRFLFQAIITYVLTANLLRTHRQLNVLLTVTVVGLGLWALEGAYRRIVLIDTGRLGVIKEFAYSHEVVIFLGILLLFAIAQQVFGGPRWRQFLALAFVPIALYTLLATERRAGYIAVMVGLLAYGVVFLAIHRKAFFTFTVPLVVLGAIYLPVFWHNTGLIGQPARAVRSISEPDPRDAASNLYRDLEKVNIRATIDANPVTGVGFGREFLFAVPLPDLSWWPFWRYEPHHNILWVWLKTGTLGFILFWVLLGSAIARAASQTRTLRDPETRTFALLALGGIIMTLVFCYVDLGLVSSRVTILLGVLLGGIGVLDTIDRNHCEGRMEPCASQP